MEDERDSAKVRYVGGRVVLEDAERVHTTAPTPERTYIVDRCIDAMTRITTARLIEMLPVLEKYAQPMPDTEQVRRLGLRVLPAPPPATVRGPRRSRPRR